MAVFEEILGYWLEVLDRRGNIHYSIFRMKNNAQLDPCRPLLMEGKSFRPDGSLHSTWDTEYFDLEKEDRRKSRAKRNRFIGKYVYEAILPGKIEQPHYGFGMVDIEINAKKPHWPYKGTGFYFASEEEQNPFRCKYLLKRLDKRYYDENLREEKNVVLDEKEMIEYIEDVLEEGDISALIQKIHQKEEKPARIYFHHNFIQHD